MIDRELFSLCLAPDGGYFTVGGVNTTLHSGDVKWVTLEDSKFHKVNLIDIKIGEKVFDIPNSYFTIIDSGTTVSYIPNELHFKILKEVKDFCSIPNKCMGEAFSSDFGRCFKVNKNIDFDQFADSMPTISFDFGNNTIFEWKPRNYLVNITSKYEESLKLCMGFIGWR